MNYIFDFFGTLVTDDSEKYYQIMTEGFKITKDEYREKVREFISTNDFALKEHAFDRVVKRLNTTERIFTPEEKNKFLFEWNVWNKERLFYDGAEDVLK